MLRNILDNVVGKDLCDRLRADLMGCNLTINTHSDHIDNILKEGYKASTLESYAKSTLSGELYDKVSDVIWGTGRAYFEEGMKELTKISEDCDYEDSNHVEAIMARAQAEYDAFGLSFEDPKPSYLAFNPIGSLDGACPEYGDGAVMQVSPEILNQCTGNDDDTFATSRPVAKVYDMEHLKDLFILKHALYDYGFQDEYESIFLDKNSPTGLRDEWSSDKMGTIPIELQFHNETVPPEYLSKYHVKSK
jgi:hypothetical protein